MEPLRIIDRIGGLAISKRYVKHHQTRIYHELKDGIPLIYHYWIQRTGVLNPFDIRQICDRLACSVPENLPSLLIMKDFFAQHDGIEDVISDVFRENTVKSIRAEGVPF